ncbi:MAG: family 43 glycosylhydrolase [Bacteroidota bacterium]|nr:family 43 glycosylhydrolase [Bacteroidota bacterium]MDP4218186.1 family 43 glycosylhydrolase [Bacteroidota bacterium]MDP4255867.1 family 43 glycosylhydrolase [Bacteroidota bacterium]
MRILLLLWLSVCSFLMIRPAPSMPPSGPSADPDSSAFFQRVGTFVNPVLPGDHPDPTLLMVGNDFYHCGSSFHFTPYLPIYHSRDLVHWEVIARVVPPSSAGWVTDRPSAGIWQGAITRFYGSYWIYFSANGQWFCKADSPKGPWSAPVQLKTNSATGPLGYDNSIFVDDDGKPYMVIKNGQHINRIQALGHDGQLTDTVIKLDWINANLQYSWAEGPVMCKRNGFYYYFPAGDVSGGQYVLRASALTSDSTKWERLGNFFKPVTDPAARFRNPNHISAPIRLPDGSWWTLGQSYEHPSQDDWSGMGRQTSLFRVVWDGDRPWGMAPSSQPQIAPDLPRSGIPWRSVRSDYFDKDTLNPCWHFLNRHAAAHYSLNARKGWLRLSPDSLRAHLLQKETDHDYSAVTRVDLDAEAGSARAGLYLTNGNQKKIARLYTGYEGGKRIVFQCDSVIRSMPNQAGNTVWLRLDRQGHLLTGYFSSDGKTWTAIGDPVSAMALDSTQPNWNSWVGTSLGLFAEGKPADFDEFIYKDGFIPLSAAGYNNYFGVERVDRGTQAFVTNTSSHGGWFMLSGVDLGSSSDPGRSAKRPLEVKIRAESAVGGNVEVWLDDLGKGTLLATIPIRRTGAPGHVMEFRRSIANFTGQHDLFIKYPPAKNAVYIRSVCFATRSPND